MEPFSLNLENVEIPNSGMPEKDRVEVNKPVRKKQIRKKGTCDNCGRTMNKNHLIKHTKICGQPPLERTFKCPHDGCGKSFGTRFYLYLHNRVVHSEPVNCPYPGCDIKLKKASLPRHITEFHEGKRAECQFCKRTVTYCSLSRHLKACQNDGSKPHACSQEGCDRTFKTKNDLYVHVRAVHSEMIKCPVEGCEAELKRGYLNHHYRQKHRRLKKQCDNCGKAVMETSMSSHRKLCTTKGQKNFQCPEDNCGKWFKTKMEKTQHVHNVHSEPVKCPVDGCEAMLKPYSLKFHMKSVHERIKKICQNCGKEFSFATLRSHKEVCISEGARVFLCTKKDCQKNFRTKMELNSHIRIVHCKPMKCPFEGCDVVMKKYSMANHIDMVHKKIQKECPYCHTKVSSRSFSRHIKRCEEKLGVGSSINEEILPDMENPEEDPLQ